MAAVAALPQQRPDRPSVRPDLRLAPRYRARPTPGRDVAYAFTLALLLVVGIIGVLLLNTAMQTQADHIAAAKQHLADLTMNAQVLQTEADRDDAPGALAARARALHLRPATTVTIVPAHTVSARARAARPTHGG